MNLIADSRDDALGGLESPYQDGGTLQVGKEKLSSSNSEELHVSKSMSLAERNKQAQRRHRQRQRVIVLNPLLKACLPELVCRQPC